MIDIHRIELPTMFGMKTVNAFLIKGDKITLIDAGENTTASMDKLKADLKSHGLKISDIEEVIITHAHVDHIGGAGGILKECDATLRVSDIVLPWAVDHQAMFAYREKVMTNTMTNLMPAAALQFFEAFYGDFKDKMKDVWTDVPQDRIETWSMTDTHINIAGQEWKTVFTPGHSNTMHCFLQEQTKQFLAADMLLKITPTPVIEPNSTASIDREKSILRMMDSFQQVYGLEIGMIYPGHYELLDDHKALIDYQVNRIHERKMQTLELIRGGTTDFADLFNILYKGRWHLPALVMLIGYLDLLVAENHITDDHEHGAPITLH